MERPLWGQLVFSLVSEKQCVPLTDTLSFSPGEGQHSVLGSVSAAGSNHYSLGVLELGAVFLSLSASVVEGDEIN